MYGQVLKQIYFIKLVKSRDADRRNLSVGHEFYELNLHIKKYVKHIKNYGLTAIDNKLLS